MSVMPISEFARDVRAVIEFAVAPTRLSFVGSFGQGEFDEFSDVDLEAEVEGPLDSLFYTGLEGAMRERFGPGLVRYDPDYAANLVAQDVRFSFYRLPVFWRVDLVVTSRSVAAQKWPSPFPEWSLGTSALMNAIWALKWQLRGLPERADQYVAKGYEKLGERMAGTEDSVVHLLDALARRADTDRALLQATKELAVARTV
jgi:hypothetical protein